MEEIPNRHLRIYETPKEMGYARYQAVQDFFHQQY